MSYSEAIRIMAWLVLVFMAFVIVLCQLFPSMRGPKWDGSELSVAVVLALLAIALRPSGD